jgi:hypothetical protein
MDTLVSAAATHYAHTPFAAPVKALPKSERINLQIRQAERFLGAEQVKTAQFQKAAKKKARVKVASQHLCKKRDRSKSNQANCQSGDERYPHC